MPWIYCEENSRAKMLGRKKKLLFRVQGERGVQRLRRDAEELRRVGVMSAGGVECALDRLALGFSER